ncbi:hypothetical protein LIER_11618 [Lithospermum erythrorhizon]|uniref:RNase H type-1 domain-containing protein n=1 Tax=Lithospermum erythrorhizon TaxID=34254 RepID=A0AAV3PNQ8_LITER
MKQVSSSLVAEAMAVREGLLFAKENKWNRVVIENDSKVLIQALRGEVTWLEDPSHRLLATLLEDCNS